ncbi:unnamed protein product [Prunus armeniaca]
MVLASEGMSEGQDEEEDDAERLENSKFNIELVIHQTELFRIEGLARRAHSRKKEQWRIQNGKANWMELTY